MDNFYIFQVLIYLYLMYFHIIFPNFLFLSSLANQYILNLLNLLLVFYSNHFVIYNIDIYNTIHHQFFLYFLTLIYFLLVVHMYLIYFLLYILYRLHHFFLVTLDTSFLFFQLILTVLMIYHHNLKTHKINKSDFLQL